MILEIDANRQLQLPDDMSDETARQLKRWILTLEERAQAAESQVRTLQDEMAGLRNNIASTQTMLSDNTATVSAIREMSVASIAELKRIFKAIAADREIVPNDLGDMTRSRVIM